MKQPRPCPTPPGSPGEALQHLLARIHLAPRQSAKSLTLWPLLGPRAPGAAPAAVPLVQALEDGFVSLGPPEGGSTPARLTLASRAPDPVLVLFGEELTLERETLAASASALVPPQSELLLPVHRVLASSPVPPPPLRAFRALPAQVGFAAARGDEILGLELLATPELFARSLATLLPFYAAEAPEEGATALAGQAPGGRGFDAPEPFLEALRAAEARPGATPGLGCELWLQGAGVAGCALVAGGVLHLVAFPSREAALPGA